MGDVRVQRMFLGVVGKSRKMPGRQETTHWQTSALLLVRPGPPNNNTNNNNKQANAAPGKEQKNNKRKQTTRNEKRKKQMQIQGGRVRSGTVTVWTAIICCCLFWRYSTVAVWLCGCGSVAASIVIIYLCPKTFHFHFHLAKGVNAAAG